MKEQFMCTSVCERTCPFTFAKEDERVKSFFGKASKIDARGKIAFTFIWIQAVAITADFHFIVYLVRIDSLCMLSCCKIYE